ncbi:MAG: hypothetical protein ACXWQO_07570 [Bdellovibrionota bacterium]
MRYLLIALAILSSAPAFARSNIAMRSVQTVIKGALIRAGGPGGTQSAPDAAIDQLCEQGVRKVLYLYPEENFYNKGPHQCSRGTTIYGAGYFHGPNVKLTLAEIQKSGMEGSGPVVVHCWNGWHAAGEISAIALMQFCDWSGERAAQYWVKGVEDKGNLGKYGSIISRIRNFRPIPGMRFSDSVKAARCP